MRPEAGAAAESAAGEGTGRVLALDWGTKRFGVALSDPTRLLAQPLTTLTRRPGLTLRVGVHAATGW